MLSKNRKAYFDYQVLESYEVGIVLIGTEVKSIRMGNVSLSESYAYIYDSSVVVKNMHVSRYKQAHISEKFDENREKKLLLHKREISKIRKLLQDNGTTLIPLELYVANNKIKVKLGVCKGKKLYDKRQSIKERDISRENRNN